MLEYSNPSTFTPLKVTEQPLAVWTWLPETCKAGGAAWTDAAVKRAVRNAQGINRFNCVLENFIFF